MSDVIDVIATTMSGSIRDQRRVGLIGPAFEARTSRPVRVHTADSHAAARAITNEIVTGGGRTIVSAGGAGTFNAVLEGAHLAAVPPGRGMPSVKPSSRATGLKGVPWEAERRFLVRPSLRARLDRAERVTDVPGELPPDLRLAFLRKGSADLIGKVLGIPDDLSAAVEAIVEGIEADRCIEADVLSVVATEPDGREQRRHLVGFGGVGVFGEVPRFTESRVIKVYKGVVGTLFGDLGPFLVGLALAMGWWRLQRLVGRVPPMSLVLDDEELAPDTWGSAIVLNGDLGDEFPLGRGLDLGSGSFRVVVLRYEGFRRAMRQIKAGRRGTLLDDPECYGAVVRTVHRLTVRPAEARPYTVNVDGLQMLTRGEVRFWVSGRVRLVSGRTVS